MTAKTYPPTDFAVLDVRPCPDCGYDIRPGWQHGRTPQPEGGSHVICALQRVQALRQFGPCQVCGVDCGETTVEGVGVVRTEHYGPVADDHEAKPGTLPLDEMLTRYLSHIGSTSTGEAE